MLLCLGGSQADVTFAFAFQAHAMPEIIKDFCIRTPCLMHPS